MELREDALELHRINRGKLAVASKVKLENSRDLSLAYSPGVAEPCKVIAQNAELSYEYTNRGNMVAVVSDGTAVLGLGDIGPDAALPKWSGRSNGWSRPLAGSTWRIFPGRVVLKSNSN
jgi:malate dehydrogenase (oxaloacetate-decarboxylating)